MHERIRIDLGKHDGDYNDWIDDLESLEDWLNKHPKATATIRRWGLEVSSPSVDDLMGFEQYDPPSGIKTSVESFSTDKDKDGYTTSWSFC